MILLQGGAVKDTIKQEPQEVQFNCSLGPHLVYLPVILRSTNKPQTLEDLGDFFFFFFFVKSF